MRPLRSVEKDILVQLTKLIGLDADRVVIPDLVENISESDIHLMFVESESQGFFSGVRYEALANDVLGRPVVISLRTKKNSTFIVISELEVVSSDPLNAVKFPIKLDTITLI